MALWKSAIVLIVLCTWGCNSQSQDKVDQHTRIQFAFEGDTVTIDCTYQTAYPTPTLFWYQQKGNGNPKHMLNKYSTSGNSEEEFKERFHANFNKTAVPLTIQDARVSDSAVYYCALQPTVTETLSTLIQKQYISINDIMQLHFFHFFSIKPLLSRNIFYFSRFLSLKNLHSDI